MASAGTQRKSTWRILLLVGLVGVATVIALARFHAPDEDRVASMSTGPSQSPPSTEPSRIGGSLHLVHAVARDIGRCLGRWLQTDVVVEVAPGDPARLCATWSGKSVLLDLNPHVWSAEAWRPVACGIVDAPVGLAEADTQEMATRLLTPTNQTVLDVDADIGKALAQHPRDARYHEQAALIAAVFACREVAQVWSDNRDGLNRATAHLAVARALAGGNGHAGRIAEALIEALVGRELAALALVRTWPANDPVFAAWGRVVTLRATGNWLDHHLSADAPLIERLAYAQALADRRSAMAVLTWLRESTPPPCIDWGRIAASSSNMAVEAGHVCAMGGIPEEAADQQNVLTILLGHAPQDDDLAQLCTIDSPDADRTRVMPPAIWGRFLARHLLGRLHTAHNFADALWGEPSAAARVRDHAMDVAAKLPLLPVLRCMWKQDRERTTMAHAATALIVEHPEMLPPIAFRYTLEALTEMRVQPPFPAARWLSDGVAVPGTTWGARGFTWLRHQQGADILPAVQEGLTFAPHHGSLATWAVHLLGNGGRLAEARPIIERLQQWDQGMTTTALQFVTGEERMVMLRAKAAMNPDAWSDLGKALVDAGRPEEAAAAFEQAFRLGQDRVKVANTMSWWVGWLLDHGQRPQAHTVAAHGREVYSNLGLQTWLLFCERTSDLDGAEHAAKAIQDRYRDTGPLMAFLTRTAPVRPASRKQIDALVAQQFPQGIAPWQEPSPVQAPLTGVRITTTKPELQRWKLRIGDVIVALDSQRCDNQAQFLLLRAMNTGPMRLVIWRHASYLSITADPPDRRFGVGLEDFTAGR